jgi:hypothetical protein
MIRRRAEQELVGETQKICMKIIILLALPKGTSYLYMSGQKGTR